MCVFYNMQNNATSKAENVQPVASLQNNININSIVLHAALVQSLFDIGYPVSTFVAIALHTI